MLACVSQRCTILTSIINCYWEIYEISVRSAVFDDAQTAVSQQLFHKFTETFSNIAV